MISVIICSINKTFAQQVHKSIADTIGVPWEMILYDNTINPESISHIYNLGAVKAKNELLCFVHEDVLFQTKNWGAILADHFLKDSGLGLIGVAGSKYKSSTPSGWYTGLPAMDCCNIIHQDSFGQQQHINFNPLQGSQTQEVVVIDGVFMCCPKKVWETVKFDDVLLTDFHLYDLDFSLKVAEKFKVIVTFEIDILHITKGGHYGNKWLESTLLWQNSVQARLPVLLPGLYFDKKSAEVSILKTWLIRLKHENIDFQNKLRWLTGIKIWMYPAAWPNIVLFMAKSIFKKAGNTKNN